MATRFKVGDTVRLKSGGPLMTVSSLTTDFDGHPVVKTTWFDKSDKEWRELAKRPPEPGKSSKQ